jgi:twitching motility protein PilJ
MKGRLSSSVWLVLMVNVAVVLTVLVVAYDTGARSGGLSLPEFALLSRRAGLMLVGTLGLLAASLWALRTLLSSRVVKPVQELVSFSKRLAEGDYKATLELEGPAEFGVIAANLKTAAEGAARAVASQQAQADLQQSVTDFLTVVSQIARGDLTLRGTVTKDALGNVVDSVNYMLDNFTKVLERVRKAATEVQNNAREILLSAEEMANGAAQQDQEITNTSAAVAELTVSMKRVSDNAEASAEAARRALDAAEQGNRSVLETLDGMQRIRGSVQITAKKIKTLGDRSLEISEIIHVINDITEHTNLLALNAAIEAARAGETGRGFGVVADEIRKLAEHSRKATKDIAALIKAIQADTNDAVVVMEEGTQEVEDGARLAEQAGRALGAISTVVRQSAELVEEISQASKQQVRGTEGVANAIQVISNITRQTSQGARQAAHTVEQLVRLSEQLNEGLSQFRIAATPGRVQLVAASGQKR